jgi:ribosomal protein L7/L12
MTTGGGPEQDVAAALQRLSDRLDYIEEHLVHMGRAIGYRYAPMPAGIPPEVVQLAREGNKLEAIRRYRALTGASLDQARGVVEGL